MIRSFLILALTISANGANAGFLCKNNRLHSSLSPKYLQTKSSNDCAKVIQSSVNGFICYEGFLYNSQLESIEYGNGDYDGFKSNDECLKAMKNSIP